MVPRMRKRLENLVSNGHIIVVQDERPDEGLAMWNVLRDAQL
jgi:hypothetical protein